MEFFSVHGCESAEAAIDGDVVGGDDFVVFVCERWVGAYEAESCIAVLVHM